MESNSNNGLAGKRYRMLLRVSTLLNDASTDDQRTAIERYAKQQGMVPAGNDEVLEGVSGSKTFNRKDLKRLLESAKSRGDYDVLMVYDSSRLTRGGPRHGSEVRTNFGKAGVLVQSVMDPVPKGDFEEVIHTLIDTQNNLYSKKLSAFIARGMISARMRGELAAHGSVPLGIDRVYLRANGNPFLRLRYIGNRKRVLYSEETGQIVQTFDPSTHSGTAYRKNKGETVTLSPGDPKVVEAVRNAFKQRYCLGWSFGRIGLELTRQGIVPLHNTLWTTCAARSFLLNPTYLGWNYFMKSRGGLHHSLSLDGPVPNKVDQDWLEEQGYESIPQVPRPRSEMLRLDWPHLKEFLLDPEVREKAEKEINRVLDEHHIRRTKQPPREKRFSGHLSSPYVLRGIMREPAFGRTFSGRLITNAGKAVRRYYVLQGAHGFAEPGSIGRRAIPAEAVESAVFDILKHALKSSHKIVEMVKDHVTRILGEKQQDDDREQLEEELAEIQARQKAIYMTANAKKLLEMKSLLDSLQAREDEVSQKLAMRPLSRDQFDAEQIAQDVLAILPRFEKGLSKEGYEKLRVVMYAMIKDFTMSLETREGCLEVALPEHVLRGGKVEDMCLPYKQIHPTTGHTHNSRSLKIGVFKLIPEKFGVRRAGRFARFRWEEVACGDTGPSPKPQPK